MKQNSKTAFFLVIIVLVAGCLYGSGCTFASACASQVKYSVGEIDPAFDLDREAVVDLSIEAGEVWNQALGEEVFVYDESAPIKINFVYEERQRDRDTMMQRINELNLEYESLTELGDKINELITDYEGDLDDFNSDVEHWNSKGGAPSQVYSDLKKRERRLEKERKHINDLINAFNNTQTEYDLSAGDVSNMISQKRNTIEEAGVLISSGDGPDVINVYIYDGDDSLKLLLVHELGHVKAGHVMENDYSVMSLTMSDQQLENLQPTKEDIEMVETCNKANI